MNIKRNEGRDVMKNEKAVVIKELATFKHGGGNDSGAEDNDKGLEAANKEDGKINLLDEGLA